MKNFIILIYAGLLGALLIWLIASSFSASTDFNIVSNEISNSKIFIKHFIPQGWAFFTADPKGVEMHFYKVKNKVYKSDDFKSTSAINWFGLSKKFRVRSLEKSKVVNMIVDWNEGENLSTVMLQEYCSERSIQNEFDSQLICGEYLVVLNEPLPYVWRNMDGSKNTPVQYKMLTITCGSSN